jgi:aminoglycoside phosphotransferase (APT) family kinase protein
MNSPNTPAGQASITPSLVRRLVASQFPQWARLPITPVIPGGWDNRTFRLGTEMSVRLPSAAGYASKVAIEQRWLPKLAPLLPLPIPTPLAQGAPAEGYPWPWSVYRWIDGESALTGRIANRRQFARDLAHFLTTLQRIEPMGGPTPGPHNFFRGGSLAVYDHETWTAIAALDGHIDTAAAAGTWRAALAAAWLGPPAWFHGDVAAGNLLVKDRRLCAVIDFGGLGVGDPACDLVIAWTFLSGESRDLFRSLMPADRAMWARAHGWALWKAMKTLVESMTADPARAAEARRVIDDVLAEHRRGP